MNSADLFDPALRALEAQGTNVFGPMTFQDYCRGVGVSAARTVAHISVDSLSHLPRKLRNANCMVLRLGQKGGGKTDFAIVRVPDEGPECFFLEDERVFELVEAESFVPDGSIRSLLPFHLLNQLKERSATSLAYATGVLERALDLDEAIASPVTDSGVYAFEFVPHPGLSPLVHNKGQIEVDGLFLARRGGGECVFVVEAKVDSKMRSVSKHKLAYPIYGMQEKVPAGIPIIPVYLRILRRSGQLMFFVAECEPFSTEPLTTLKVKRASAFNLILPALSIN